MANIITITFSPVIDKSTSIPSLIPEKKLKCSQPKLEPGGGGINVSRAIKKLGGHSHAIFPVGGYSGEYFLSLVKEEGLECLTVKTKAPTRENMIVYDEATGLQYRFGMPGSPLEDAEWREMIALLEKQNDVSFIVVSGSLPPGVPQDITAAIAAIAKSKNAKLIVDSSGEALEKAAECGVFLLKPNLSELAALVGKSNIELEEVDDAARELIDKGSAEAIVVSLGAAGALLVTKGKEKQFVPPRIKVKSTVGAGDSMVAGIIYSLSNGKDLESAVCYGVACGTAATMNSGTELFKPEDVNRIYKYIERAPVK
ncbi:hexose kinase [Pollutibacter soli]|uniref:1-phosphofructokinase family hexose kinase n=1 Tax=Pollutibacter soli TaxID=3034157 RepID=UPI003013E713